MDPDWNERERKRERERERERERNGERAERLMSCVHKIHVPDTVKGITTQCSMVYVIESLTASGVLGSTIKPYSFASQGCIVVSAKHPDGIFNLAHSLRPMANKVAAHGVLAVCSYSYYNYAYMHHKTIYLP